MEVLRDEDLPQHSNLVQFSQMIEDGEDYYNLALIHSKNERIPLKNFKVEVRAELDISKFYESIKILLDITETNVELIIEEIIKESLELCEPQYNLHDVKTTIFTHDTEMFTLANTIRSFTSTREQTYDFDQTWLCALCDVPGIFKHHVAIARLFQSINFGPNSQEIRFIILVIAPIKEKGTKTAMEVGRTFATIFANMEFRNRVLNARNETEFRKLILKRSNDLKKSKTKKQNDIDKEDGSVKTLTRSTVCKYKFAQGLRDDFWRRFPHYLSDYTDGIVGHKTIQKVMSTTLFLYFACLLPSIALGVLNANNTNNALGVKKVIYSQTIGGLIFAVFGGQPLVILLTTAPLALYSKIIFSICEDFQLDFFSMYACVGLWNAFFLIVYAIFDLSRVMKYMTRSTGEVFGIFISIALTVDALKATYYDFEENYLAPGCYNNSDMVNATELKNLSKSISMDCPRANSILYLLLMAGTLWLGLYLYNFNKTPFLSARKREILSDYALPVAVIMLSFLGSFVFQKVEMKPFQYLDDEPFKLVKFHHLSVGAVFGSMGLGLLLSFLFFMDQNISSAIINHPSNKCKKGSAYNLDLLVVAVINIMLSIFAMPWIHAALPHCPLHVRALAEVEERIDQGHVHEVIVKVRETRLTVIFSHILIGISLFLLPYPIAYIPRAVLSGLFLYMAVTALEGMEMFDRILLIFTEQTAYPPNHYIRQVHQRQVHMFTGCQVLQLGLLCGFGFAPYPYIKMIFPVLLFLLLPIRHKVIPLLIKRKYLEALDGN